MTYSTFSTVGDLIQEYVITNPIPIAILFSLIRCLKTCEQAIFYFEGVGDEIRLGKAMAMKAEV